MNEISNIIVAASKGIQLLCDATQLGRGIIQYHEDPPEERLNSILQMITGIARLAFSSMEVTARECDASNLDLTILKSFELVTVIGLAPAEFGIELHKFAHGRITALELFEKALVPIASFARIGTEASIDLNKYILGLNPEDLAKLNQNFSASLDRDQIKFIPFTLEASRLDLEAAENREWFIAMLENALRTSMLSSSAKSVYSLYSRLNALHRQEHPIAPQNLPVAAEGLEEEPVDPFDLLKLDHIPFEYHGDPVFIKYECPIIRLPIRHAVMDPTVCNSSGECISPPYEKKELIKWINLSGKSPRTSAPLHVRQIRVHRKAKRDIDARLMYYSEKTRQLAKELADSFSAQSQDSLPMRASNAVDEEKV